MDGGNKMNVKVKFSHSKDDKGRDRTTCAIHAYVPSSIEGEGKHIDVKRSVLRNVADIPNDRVGEAQAFSRALGELCRKVDYVTKGFQKVHDAKCKDFAKGVKISLAKELIDSVKDVK